MNDICFAVFTEYEEIRPYTIAKTASEAFLRHISYKELTVYPIDLSGGDCIGKFNFSDIKAGEVENVEWVAGWRAK